MDRRFGPALLPVGIAAATGIGGVLVAAGVPGAVAAVTRPDAIAGQATLAAAVGDVAATAAGLLLLWLALGAAVHTVDLLRRRRGRAAGRLAALLERAFPALTRRLVAAALGAGAFCVTAVPASAASLDPGWAPMHRIAAEEVAEGAVEEATPRLTPEPAASREEPGWTPPRPPEPAPPAVAVDLGPLSGAARSTATADEAVVVRRGDTLWDIAARFLPAGAGNAQIASEWPRWYAANKAVIGPDPDLIVPGMRLLPPAAGLEARS